MKSINQSLALANFKKKPLNAMIKSVLFGSTLAISSLGALAAEETKQESAQDIETITVTGAALRMRASVSAKASSNEIADFMGTDDLGQTPDLNIAESLRRLPGVNTIFDEDEGQFVTIRGLDPQFTYVAFDGAQMPSSDRSNRKVNTEMVPSTAVKRLEVYKSVTPEHEANSIGGYVNLVTRSAFDADGQWGVVTASAGSHTNTDLPAGDTGLSPRLDLAYSNTFGENEQFGVFVAGTYIDKIRHQSKNEAEWATLNGVAAATEVKTLDYTNKIERRSGMVKFEYRPTDELYIHLNHGYFKQKYNEVRYFTNLYSSGDAADYTTSADGVGSVNSAQAYYRTNEFLKGDSIKTTQLGFDYYLNDLSKIDVMVASSLAKFTQPDLATRYEVDPSADLGYSYDINNGKDGLPGVAINDASTLNDLNDYSYKYYQRGDTDAEEDIKSVAANYAYNMEDDGFGFKVGVKNRTLDRFFDAENTRYTYNSDTYAIGDFGTFKAPDLGYSTIISDHRGDVNYFLNNPDMFTQSRTDGDNIGKDWTLSEDVFAAYAMGKYETEEYTIIGGLRYEKTETESTGYQLVDGTFESVSNSGSYSNLLPSLIATYNLNEDMRIKIGLSQTIGRPNYGDMTASVNSAFNLNANGDMQQGSSVKVNNPELEARKANNYDLSFEWFIADGHFFSAAIFHKDIKNYIFSDSTFITDLSEISNYVEFEGTGQLAAGASLEVLSPVNAEDAVVDGFEMQYINEQLTFLPGFLSNFGTAINLTLVDGEVELPSGEVSPLLEQPDWQYNISLTYSQDEWDAALSYNNRAEYVEKVKEPGFSRIAESTDSLDFSLRYAINDNLSAKFQARGIIGGERAQYFGQNEPGNGYVHQTNDYGSSYWFSVTYKL